MKSPTAVRSITILFVSLLHRSTLRHRRSIQRYFSDRLTAHSFVQQHQRIGTAGQPVRGGTVASQLNQVAARFAVQEARSDHG